MLKRVGLRSTLFHCYTRGYSAHFCSKWCEVNRLLEKEVIMMAKKNYEERTEALLEPIVAAAGVSVYDVEYVKEGGEWYLRAYIDKPDGVNINDCEAVSRALSDKLDEEDFIEDAYILEVSSPGLGRTLKKDKHLQKSIGEEVELKTYKPIDGQKEFEGILKAFDKENLTIEMDGTEKVFARGEVARIALALDF